jgi:hypothetical protein
VLRRGGVVQSRQVPGGIQHNAGQGTLSRTLPGMELLSELAPWTFLGRSFLRLEFVHVPSKHRQLDARGPLHRAADAHRGTGVG